MSVDGLRQIQSASTKYDGSIHYEFDAYLVDHADSHFRLFIPAGTPNRSYRGPGVFEVDIFASFFPGDSSRAFNVFMHLDPYPRHGFVMAADMLTDAHLDGDTLRWIDMDLDVEVFDDGRVELVDEDEFEEHQRRFGYPAALVDEARQSAAQALELARSGRFPFDRADRLAELRSLAAELKRGRPPGD